MRIAVLVLILSFAVPNASAQEPAAPAHPTPQQHAVSAGDAAALRQDVQRMKALVQQMQTNLAFVTSIQGPLKHQFELEIEMWQLEIARMERRLGPEPGKE